MDRTAPTATDDGIVPAGDGRGVGQPLTLRETMAAARGPVAASAAAGSGAGVLTAVLVLLAGRLLGGDEGVSPALALMLGGAVLARAALTGWIPTLRARAFAASRDALQSRIYRFVLGAGPAVTDFRSSGELVSLATDASGRLSALVATFVPLVARGVVVPLVVIGLAAGIDAPSSLAMLAAFLLVPPVLRQLERSFRDAGVRLRTSQDTLAAEFLDAIQGLETLVLYRADQRWSDRLSRRAEEVRADTMRVLAVAQRSLIVVDIVYGVVAVIGVAAFLIWRVSAGQLDPPEAVTLGLLAVVAATAWVDVVAFFYIGGLGLAALKRIQELLSTPRPETGDATPDVPPRGEVRINGVAYTYPAAATPALSDITLYLPAGESVALVGPSGAGKTTLASLIRGRRRPSRGTITVDGVDIAAAAPDWIARRVAYVGQDTHVFAASLADNLRLGDPTATDGDLLEACRRARLADLVQTLPESLETPVGERGQALSGGEAQRLAIARAFLADRPILIVDEATSSLDLETEELVTEALSDLMRGRTTIVIAHRATTARRCDRVVHLENGSVMATGDPSTMEGFFRRMQIGRL